MIFKPQQRLYQLKWSFDWIAEVPANMIGRPLLLGIPATLGIKTLNGASLTLQNGMYVVASINEQNLSVADVC
jgi:hypothetical protein